MESTISSTNWHEGDTITLTVSNVSYDFPLTLWVANYSSSDLSKTPVELVNEEGKVFETYAHILSSTQTISSDHSSIQTLTPIVIEAYDPQMGMRETMESPISDNEYEIGTTYNITYIIPGKITGIITWLRQWFYTKDEIDSYDTGWTDLTYVSGYANYGGGYCNLKVRRIHKLVEIRGVFKPTAQKTASTNAVQFATVPEGYRPTYQYRSAIQQGSALSRWNLSVETNGKLCWSRYGKTSSENVPSPAWMCVHITYMIDG